MRHGVCVAIWGAAVSALFLWASHLTATPGTPGEPPTRWPAGSALTVRSDRPTLLIFLHPSCPCSRASLAEFEILLGSADSPPTAIAVFQGTEPAVRDTPFWREATAVRGLAVVADGGAERERFGARTSGETLFYDAAGRLLFRGGVTAGRGHRGENSGRLTVAALLERDRHRKAGRSNSPAGSRCPVYGCPLTDHRAAAPATSEARP